MVIEIGALNRLLKTKTDDLPTRPQPFRARVVGVEDGPVGRFLVVDDLRLGRCIRLHRRMSVEVVGGDVQHRGYPWTARHDLQLKTRQLHHRKITGTHLIEIGDKRITDVAADPDLTPGPRLGEGGEDPSDQRRRRRLARTAGDANRHHFRRALLQENLRVIAEWDASLPRRLRHRAVRIHTSRKTEQVRAIQQVRRMAAVALGRMKATAGLPTLRKFYTPGVPSPDPVTNACVWAVGQITGERLPPPGTVEVPQLGWFLTPTGG